MEIIERIAWATCMLIGMGFAYWRGDHVGFWAGFKQGVLASEKKTLQWQMDEQAKLFRLHNHTTTDTNRQR